MMSENIENVRLRLRKKYADGYVSDYYMRTGIPQIVAERAKAASGKPKRKARSAYKKETHKFR